MVCQSANYEWSQYSQYWYWCSQVFSLSLSITLIVFPKGSRIWWSLHKVCSVLILSLHIFQRVYIFVATSLARACCFMIGSALVTLHNYCPLAELCNFSLWYCGAVNWQVTSEVFSGLTPPMMLWKVTLSLTFDYCCANLPLMYNHWSALRITKISFIDWQNYYAAINNIFLS